MNRANCIKGGRLQALVVESSTRFDTRNGESLKCPATVAETEWIDLSDPQSLK